MFRKTPLSKDSRISDQSYFTAKNIVLLLLKRLHGLRNNRALFQKIEPFILSRVLGLYFINLKIEIMTIRIRPVLIFIAICFNLVLLSAQKPQKIMGIAKEDQPISYYQEQSRLWKKLIDKDPRNGEAWINHYKAERATAQLDPKNNWPNQKTDLYQQLDPIIKQAQKHLGQAFEYYYLLGMNSPEEGALRAFKKAYEIDPDRSEIYGWLLSRYAPLFAEKELRDLSERMLKANIYSHANLTWNYNALVTANPNGVFISNGDLDGTPKWVLQYGAGIRPDVLVITKWFLASDEAYRKKIWQKLQLKSPGKKESDFDQTEAYADYLVAEILQKSKRPTYISSGTSIQFFKKYGLEENIFLVGNALQYSAKPFDNTGVLKKNIEENYYLEYLLHNLQQHPEDGIIKAQMNLTYLPAFVHLRDHYKKTKQTEKMNRLNKLIQKVASDSGRKEEVLNWFK